MDAWSASERDTTFWIMAAQAETAATNNPHRCALWTGRKTNSGYPRISITIKGKVSCDVLVHRLVYFIGHPQDTGSTSMDVSHRCHTKLCVNPDHLLLESRRENNARKACARRGKCMGHGQAKACLYKVGDYYLVFYF